MKKACIFFIVFLFINQTWAGTEFICRVSMNEDIMKAGIENGVQKFKFYDKNETTRSSGHGSYGSKEVFGGSYDIAIYINESGDVYTNISSGILMSYAQNDIVKQIYGQVNQRLSYLAYLSDFNINMHRATWNFVFFDPSPIIETIKRRYYIISKCVMNNYEESWYRDAHTGFSKDETPNYPVRNIDISTIIQHHVNRPFIKKHFDNIYEFTDDPEKFKEYEGKQNICEKMAGPVMIGITIGVGMTMCTFDYLVRSGYIK